MTAIDPPVPNKKLARTAGLLYLIVVLTGIFSLAYVPSQLIVTGDSSATVANIIASETLFRSAIFAGAVCYIAFLFLPLVLYRLLAHVHHGAAVAMVALAVTSVPLSFVNLRNKLDVVSLLDSAHASAALPTEQLQAQVLRALDAYGNGILLSEVFWGLWLLPFGYLVFKSGLLPKVLGVLLMLGCAGYLIDFSGKLLFAGYAAAPWRQYVTMPAALGEIGTCLWLLVMGARERLRT